MHEGRLGKIEFSTYFENTPLELYPKSQLKRKPILQQKQDVKKTKKYK